METHARTNIYVHICIHTYIYTHNVCLHRYIHTYIIHTYTHIMHICMHTYVHSYIYTYIHMHIKRGESNRIYLVIEASYSFQGSPPSKRLHAQATDDLSEPSSTSAQPGSGE